MSDLRILPAADPLQNVVRAAEALAAARVEFAETFIRAQAAARKPITDRQAHELTVAATRDAVGIAEAHYQIALHLMRKES